MLWAIAAIVVAGWLLGLVTGTTWGGFIHVLLVIPIVVLVVKIIQGQKPAIETAPASHRAFEYHGILFKARGSRSRTRRGTDK